MGFHVNFISQTQMTEKRAEEMVDSAILKTTTYLLDQAEGRGHSQLEFLTLKGLEPIHVGLGIIRCNLLVTDRVSEADGNWHVGAIAAVMDVIGAAAVCSSGGGLYTSVDFNSSFYSTARIQEEVEVEAKVIGKNGGLKSAVIEVRRKDRGELIASGRLWMTLLSPNVKKKVPQLSKL